MSDPLETSGASETARDAAVLIARRLRQHGHVALLAGGCVRDRLRGEEPSDYDIATDATPGRVSELFRHAKGVGEAFGVMLVRRGNHVVEVATFRSDGTYRDGRRPESVEFGTPEADARRRDFTINGLFEDPETGAIIDYVGGQADLSTGVIRAIGVPADRFAEDRLRMLRAVRFAARFGYAIDEATRRAIVTTPHPLLGVSRERVGIELRKMLATPGRARAVLELESLGLDSDVLEATSDSGASRAGGDERASVRVAALGPTARFEAALVAWLLDRAERICSIEPRRVVPGGEEPARTLSESAVLVASVAARAAAVARALSLSNAERALVANILTQVAVLLGVPGASGFESPVDLRSKRAAGFRGSWRELSVAMKKRCAAEEGFCDALALVAATHPAMAEAIGREVEGLAASDLAPPPLVSGDDLVALGFLPGPDFRRILDAVYDAQLEGRVESRDDAVALARTLAQSEPFRAG